ncbi:hypothetical protein T492DRAFT_968702 [Pavlovales sp. CCMP2436]|nr:hypothetical protein T492DRAFT_968702 [Pavlovales sp. CCMP2436]
MMLLFATMLLLLSRAVTGAVSRGGEKHAETPLKATQATTTMLLPAATAVGCASRACGGRCCARRRAAHGDAAQGYQDYEDDTAPCGRHGRAAAAEARPRRGVGTGAHTRTPFGGLGRSLDLSVTSTKPVTEQHLLNHAESIGTRGGAQASAAD